LLDSPNERPQQYAASGEFDDWVCDELAGTVVRHFAATLHANHLDSALFQFLFRRHNVALVRVAAQRQNCRMLEQEQLVRNLFGASLRDQVVLHLPSIAIRDTAEPLDLDRERISHARTIPASV
jgi:hypothetical protein